MTLIALAQTAKLHLDKVRRLQAQENEILDGDGTGILSSVFNLEVNLAQAREDALQASSALVEALLTLDAYHSGVRSG